MALRIRISMWKTIALCDDKGTQSLIRNNSSTVSNCVTGGPYVNDYFRFEYIHILFFHPASKEPIMLELLHACHAIRNIFDELLPYSQKKKEEERRQKTERKCVALQ